MYNGNYKVASLVYIYTVMYLYVQKRYFPLWFVRDTCNASSDVR